jgi:predicted CopG family antitoxin
MLRDLKDSVGDFKTRFTAQKETTWQVLGYMASQYEELRDMIGEKRRLESLMQL